MNAACAPIRGADVACGGLSSSTISARDADLAGGTKMADVGLQAAPTQRPAHLGIDRSSENGSCGSDGDMILPPSILGTSYGGGPERRRRLHPRITVGTGYWTSCSRPRAQLPARGALVQSSAPSSRRRYMIDNRWLRHLPLGNGKTPELRRGCSEEWPHADVDPRFDRARRRSQTLGGAVLRKRYYTDGVWRPYKRDHPGALSGQAKPSDWGYGRIAPVGRRSRVSRGSGVHAGSGGGAYGLGAFPWGQGVKRGGSAAVSGDSACSMAGPNERTVSSQPALGIRPLVRSRARTTTRGRLPRHPPRPRRRSRRPRPRGKKSRAVPCSGRTDRPRLDIKKESEKRRTTGRARASARPARVLLVGSSGRGPRAATSGATGNPTRHVPLCDSSPPFSGLRGDHPSQPRYRPDAIAPSAAVCVQRGRRPCTPGPFGPSTEGPSELISSVSHVSRLGGTTKERFRSAGLRTGGTSGAGPRRPGRGRGDGYRK